LDSFPLEPYELNFAAAVTFVKFIKVHFQANTGERESAQCYHLNFLGKCYLFIFSSFQKIRRI